MSLKTLERYLPAGTLPFLGKWFGDYFIHIKITKDRTSKLGDYRKLRDGTHEITLNSTLQPQLFFFVLTHELAHLLAFERFGRRIAPHGAEWKHTYREMLLESLAVYPEDLRPVILRFSASPKANFMASPELVRYFDTGAGGEGVFIEEIGTGEHFTYKGAAYRMLGRRKKNYLCVEIRSGREYAFHPMAKVEKHTK